MDRSIRDAERRRDVPPRTRERVSEAFLNRTFTEVRPYP